MGSITRKIALAGAAALACGAASASEDYDLRYAPGIGGADMSAPFEGGWVFQAPVYAYQGKVKNDTVVQTPLALLGVPIPGAMATTTAHTTTTITVDGILPRLSYMSQEKILGAQIGATALLPLVQKQSQVRIDGVTTAIDAPGLPQANADAIANGLNNMVGYYAAPVARYNSGKDLGFGDLEVSPILRWSTDQTQLLFVGTIVAPTGKYKGENPANASAGRFWTVRPAVQYSYIGEGWDVGTRVAYSVNTRNIVTKYRTGNYLNVDLTLMKQIDDSMRYGVTAYAVAQTTKDTMGPVTTPPTELPLLPTAQDAQVAREAATANQRGHVFGIGPEFAYIKGAGEYLAEARVIKEFGASSDRPEGWAFWAVLSKPF